MIDYTRLPPLLQFPSIKSDDIENLLIAYKEVYLSDYCHVAEKHRTHDDQIVLFYQDRFEHAFYTSSNFMTKPGLKNKVDLKRLERLHWIQYIISGRIPKTICYEVMKPQIHKKNKCRLYALGENVGDDAYVVWLEPTNKGFWKFSSAYLTNRNDFNKNCIKPGTYKQIYNSSFR